MSEPTSAPILTVTWETVIGARLTECDHETGAQDYEEISLGEAVVAQLAQHLSGEVREQIEAIRKSTLDRARREIEAERSAGVRDEISAIVRECLTEEIQQTDGYGRPKGEPVTMRELMRQDVQAYLAEPERRSSYDEKKGGFRELLRAEVHDALTTELRDEIRNARAQVADQVRGKVAALIASTVKAETR